MPPTFRRRARIRAAAAAVVSLPLNIVIHGSSQLNGVAPLLDALLPASATVNQVIQGGVQTSVLTAAFLANVHNAYYNASKRNIVILSEGIDDINDWGANGTTSYQHYVDYGTEAKSRGNPRWEFWPCTLMDTTENDPPDPKAGFRDTLNASLRSGKAGGDGLIEIEADPRFSVANNAAANTTYYQADGIHPTDPVGRQALAGIIAPYFL